MTKVQQREPRRQAAITAHMRVADEWVEVGIANVSPTGLMVKFAGGPRVGNKVELRRRGTSISGEVVWWTATRFGVRSFEEIDSAALLASGLQPGIAGRSRPRLAGHWHWRQAR